MYPEKEEVVRNRTTFQCDDLSGFVKELSIDLCPGLYRRATADTAVFNFTLHGHYFLNKIFRQF